MATQVSPEQRLIMLERAVAHTESAFNTWEAQSEPARNSAPNRMTAHKALSNLLYFLAAIVREGGSRRYGNPDLERYLRLTTDLPINGHRQMFKSRDNLMHALVALDRMDEAFREAAATFRELRATAEEREGRPLTRAGIAEALIGSERTCFVSAMEVLFSAEAVDDAPRGN